MSVLAQKSVLHKKPSSFWVSVQSRRSPMEAAGTCSILASIVKLPLDRTFATRATVRIAFAERAQMFARVGWKYEVRRLKSD